jgi:hypothetical protein
MAIKSSAQRKAMFARMRNQPPRSIGEAYKAPGATKAYAEYDQMGGIRIWYRKVDKLLGSESNDYIQDAQELRDMYGDNTKDALKYLDSGGWFDDANKSRGKDRKVKV